MLLSTTGAHLVADCTEESARDAVNLCGTYLAAANCCYNVYTPVCKTKVLHPYTRQGAWHPSIGKEARAGQCLPIKGLCGCHVENSDMAVLLNHHTCTAQHILWMPTPQHKPVPHVWVQTGSACACGCRSYVHQKADSNTHHPDGSVICEQHAGANVVIQCALLLLRPAHAWCEPNHLWCACEHAQDDTEGCVRPHTLATQGLQL